MHDLAFVFPGQGAQFVGMAQDLAEAFPQAASVLETADRVLGEPLSRLMAEGPEETLKQTINTQPAVVSHSLALWAVLRERGVKPAMVAGHSVGEYAALAVCGALDIGDALKLVRQRAQAMQRASEQNPGTMAALIGADPEKAEKLCQACGGRGVLEVANLNSPGQVVVSGTREGVELAGQKARDFAIRRVLPLAVGGAFHSTLMTPAAVPLGAAIDAAPLRTPSIALVANVTACPTTEVDGLRSVLKQQVVSRVRWEDSIRQMVADGVRRFLELGPGKVLSGMIRKIDSSVEVTSVSDRASLELLLSEARV